MAKVTHLNLSIAHIRAARGLLDWSAAILAERAGLNPVTVRRLESKNQGNEATRKAVHDALTNAGITFQNGGQPGARLMPPK